MKITISNIGIVKEAEIDLNGITVICGNNNTGKSTVGKTLFSIYNSSYRIDENILSQLIVLLMNDTTDIIRRYIKDDNGQSFTFIIDEPFKCDPETFIKFCRQLSDNKSKGIKQVNEFVESHLEYDYYDDITNTTEMGEKIYLKIKDTFNMNIEGYKRSRVNSFFKGVLGQQLVNAKNSEATIKAKIKSGCFDIHFKPNEEPEMSIDFDFTNKAILIDSPDRYKISLSDWNPQKTSMEHTLFSLADELLNNNYEDSNDINRTKIEERLAIVDDILNKAIKGKFIRNDEKNSGFQFDELDIPINISNLSTGVRSLLLLRTLFQTGKISDRDVLILDEPEIHLHPEWQLIYAETIVKLQKEFNLTVLITSHSLPFVRAIECYCDYYERMKDLDVYKTIMINNFEYTLENLSYLEYGVSELYDDFSKPYSELDQLLEEKYN